MFMKPLPSLFLALLFLNVHKAMLAGAAGPAGVAGEAGPAGVAGAAGSAGVAGAAGPAGVAGAAGSAGVAGAAGSAGGEEPILEIYMHDILGGSVPTARPVTGLLGNIYSSQVPFAKPIGFLPPAGAVAVPNANGANPTVNGLNGLPLGTGLSGTAFAGNANPQNVQTQLGADGLGLGFGTITVIDDILTTTPDLGSQTLGKAQGVYVASSADGSKQLMAFTALLEGGEYNDNLNFFGVYTIGSSISQLSVTGGTGKFKNAYGIAEVRPLIPPGQHATDGAETLLRITVHLKY